MTNRVTSLERAFQLARSGSVRTVHELRLALERERYDSKMVEGPSLSRQLRDVIKAALAKARTPAPAVGQESVPAEITVKDLNASKDE